MTATKTNKAPYDFESSDDHLNEDRIAEDIFRRAVAIQIASPEPSSYRGDFLTLEEYAREAARVWQEQRKARLKAKLAGQ